MKIKALFFLLLGGLIFFPGLVKAQVYSNREIDPEKKLKGDTLPTEEYPYVLPILGKKATAAGFSLPYSAGIGVNYIWQESKIVINTLEIGFNQGEKYNLDDVVRFNDAVSSSNIINFRPDIWLLPFLNVYGIFARSQTSTAVDFGIWVPDTTGYTQVTSARTKAQFDGVSMGFGFTPTIGIGGGWLALDMNFTWTDIEALEKPAFGFIFGPRIGKTFKWFKHPERNIAFWAGGFRVKINSDTKGSLPLNELADFDQALGKIDEAQAGVEAAYARLETWWNGLSQQEQSLKQPIYDRATESLQKVNQLLTGAENAFANVENSTVEYSLQKQQKDLWNFVVGAQYQHNKHWMLRLEYGFLGSRDQVIAGLQYRFGL